MKEVYPDCDIRGCVFHWRQAVMRRSENNIPGASGAARVHPENVGAAFPTV